MEDYKKKLDDEHRRIIEEIHLNFMEERERIIRDRDAEIEKEGENDILGNSVFRIEKTCIDCDEEYEAVYHEIGGLNCHVCGLSSHGCKYDEIISTAELYKRSTVYKWLCYECTKEVELR